MSGELKEAPRRNITRRSFVALAAATGTALALGSQSWPQALAEETHDSGSAPSGEGVQRIRTMCRGCGKMECSSWVTVENGRAIKIEGDESNFGASGNCCSKSQASLQACYHPDRLRYPLKRTNPKGDDDPGWVRISWDEALQTSADKLNEIKEQRGGNSLLTMCGTSRIYCMASAGGLQGILDTTNTYQAYQICKGPRHVATGIQSNRAFSWMATVDRPRVLVVWGGGAEISNYDDSCRTMVDVATKADKFIIVDPRLTNLGKEADIWLPLRPGTDAAMALGWLNVIVNNKLYNEMWVKRWTDLPYLVVEDMEPTEGVPGSLFAGRPVKTKLLKESDITEGGSSNRFMVWDKIGQKLTWHDCSTGYWEGEAPLELTDSRQLPGKEATQTNLIAGVKQGYVPDMSDFSRCDPVIDPDYEVGEFEVTLKDGSTAKVKPVWSYFVSHLDNYDPDTVAGICEVPAEDIINAATTYATPLEPGAGYGNGGIQYMLAVEHSCNSVQTCRAIDAIVGLTNNFDTPAGNRGATIGPFSSGQFDMGFMNMLFVAPDTPTFEHNRELWENIAGVKDIPMLPQLSIWGDATAIWDCCNRSERSQYPIYGGICQSGDVMNMSNSLWGWEALKQLDFLLDLDLWHTPTSQLADILLPVRHWLEVDCPRTSQGSGGMEGSHCKAVAPLAETWYDIDIIIQLAKYMGVPWNPTGQTEAEMWPDSIVDIVNTSAGYEPLVKDYPGENVWEQWKNYFQEQGMQDMKALQPDVWGSYRRYETGVVLSPQTVGGGGAVFSTPGLNTPTKKQEIWSTIIETYHSAENPFYGQDIPYYSRPDEKSADLFSSIGPFTLPTYTEPPESPVAQPDRAEEYPYIMTTGRRIPVYFHSEHRQLPWCRELWPTPRCEINPADAEELGVEQGDWVWIETEHNKIRQVVDLYYGIRPGTINCEHQWWMPEFKAAMKGYDLININTLVNKDLRDPLCGSNYARAYNVKVYKATAENSPDENPVPLDVDGVEMITSCSDPRLKEWLPVYDDEESDQYYAERNVVQL